MTRKSRRELERAVAELADDAAAEADDPGALMVIEHADGSRTEFYADGVRKEGP